MLTLGCYDSVDERPREEFWEVAGDAGTQAMGAMELAAGLQAAQVSKHISSTPWLWRPGAQHAGRHSTRVPQRPAWWQGAPAVTETDISVSLADGAPGAGHFLC